MTIDESSIWSLLKNNYQQLLAGLGITFGACPPIFRYCYGDWNHFEQFSVSPYKWLRWTSEILSMVIRGIPLMLCRLILNLNFQIIYRTRNAYQ